LASEARGTAPEDAPAPPPGAAPGDAPAEDAPALPRGYARARAKDDAARAALEPLAPGERPRTITVAAVTAAVVAAGNLLAGLLAADRDSGDWTTTLLLSGVFAIAAAGMWRGRYWAALLFEALLGVTLVFAFFGLLLASNLRAVVLSVAVIAGAGILFVGLIRPMARLQMPRRDRVADATGGPASGSQ
jgi:hypothetical protein